MKAKPYITIGFSKANWKRFKRAAKIAARDEPYKDFAFLLELIQYTELVLKVENVLEVSIHGRPASDIHGSLDCVFHNDSEGVSS